MLNPTFHLMPLRARKLARLACIALASVSVAALGASAPAADYKLTVSKERLLNAQNEPQNWLMMNGDYASMRYSKLTQINRDNVKNLRMVWALALGGMQDIGQNGPENEVNPLIDNGYMYTTDGWGTVYKIDARDPNKGEFVWISNSGVRHEGNVPRTRGIALWEDKVIANLPDGRVIALNRDSGEIVWDKKVAVANEFGSREKFFTAPMVIDGKVIVANGAGDGATRGWLAALDVNTGKLQWYFQYTPNDGWDYDEIGVHMLYDVNINGETRKVVGHFGRNGFFYSLDRNNGSFIKGAQYVNDLNWTKGLDPKTGKPVEYDPKLDVQTYVPAARQFRGDGMKRTCPTWHGGVAHQPPAYNPVKHIAYGVGAEGCFSQNGAKVAFKGPDGGIDAKNSEKRTFTSDLYYGAVTAYDTVNNKVVAKAVQPIELRSGALATAGGVVFTATQDGWVIAYNDETLEELWRFNVGTPLKGAPVTYAIGPKQYLAVQTSGRHLHPVKFDKLENSSYLFVFALN